ncbi:MULTISPECIES: hypothetical protein [unclassified Streptomyces]|uniref:hypothetical protein n=1 Tax=unclassified Streptomyces TaxID=2593676 RepID=UPI0004CC8E37|nr:MULTISPECIES: hypothetical protein [unclassified Streptomyces]KOV86110.1 hypothetical protein ADL02_19690 [Streptomyces sp. NRRL WC-3723]
MNTRSVNSAAGVILAAMQQNRTPAGIALALESAGLLMSPEAARDMASVSTDAVSVAERAVEELKREHANSAELQRLLDKAYDDLIGANLSLHEEEQEAARLRLALKSAQRGRRELRAELYTEQEQHRTTLEQRNTHAQELLALRGGRATPYTATPEAHAQMREGLTRYFSGSAEPDDAP